MRELKAPTAGFIRRVLGMDTFAWQEGYGAFTVSALQIDAIKNYIENQEEHHRVKTFQEEYLEFLNRCGVKYDERYLW